MEVCRETTIQLLIQDCSRWRPSSNNTLHVMNYFCAACRSRLNLEQFFEDCGHLLKEYPKLEDRRQAKQECAAASEKGGRQVMVEEPVRTRCCKNKLENHSCNWIISFLPQTFFADKCFRDY